MWHCNNHAQTGLEPTPLGNSGTGPGTYGEPSPATIPTRPHGHGRHDKQTRIHSSHTGSVTNLGLQRSGVTSTQTMGLLRTIYN